MYRQKLNTIIGFSIAQNVKRKGIYITTLIIALVCVLVFPLLAFVTLKPESKKDKEGTRIKNIHIYDESNLENIDYNSIKDLNKEYTKLDIKVTKFDKENSFQNKKTNSNSSTNKTVVEEAIKKYNDNGTVIAHITHKKDICIDVFIPKESKVSKKNAEIMAAVIKQVISTGNCITAVRDTNDLKELMMGIEITVSMIGKGKVNESFTMIKMFAPMIYSFIMYFMLITYGQSLSNSMVEEKNTKLIELLVTLVRPSKLVVGKVLGFVIVAVSQIVIWIGALIAGIGASNIVSHRYIKKDFIDVERVINIIKNANIDSAFSVEAVIIFMLLMLLGFVFYLVYAAICGSFINKPDEASSVLAIYTYTIVIGFFATYIITFAENVALIKVIQYIPFCTPFVVPINVLLGNTTIGEGVIVIVIMLISVCVILRILGSVYERLVFNTLSIKELIRKSS